MQAIPFFSGALNFEDSTVLILLLHDEKLEFIMSLFEDAGKKKGFRFRSTVTHFKL